MFSSVWSLLPQGTISPLNGGEVEGHEARKVENSGSKMQSDDLIWSVIGNKGFCSFKVKIETTAFCKNEYNVTGLCNRTSCPLANSRYATVLEKDGVCYLYMKTIERAHTPAKLWERKKLSKNFTQALSQIDEALMYWPRPLKQKCKVRLAKIMQYLIRSRKLLKTERRELVGISRKIDRREKKREEKAETAARLEDKIRAELLARLKKGVTNEDEIVNIEGAFNKLMEEGEDEEKLMDVDLVGDDESDLEDDEEQEEGEEEEEEEEPYEEDEPIEEVEEPFIEYDSDLEDVEAESIVKKKGARPAPPAASKKKKKGEAEIEIEYEEPEGRQMQRNRR
ncbi:RNA binding motif protein 13 [Planoprotostelium fungivorum]|uniref:Protein MAK16 homolog n=1 Tax=Planoprotostelium fungivorum TaxID=1890364 RepID=A0A2P6N4T1_9EUKA|nr:RNA binding motif protein 13 [Planoprotostelium fungivorum]